MNFKNYGNQPMDSRSGSGRPPGNFPLTRQGSLYSLTFDELQNTTGSIGKDFGSMNMDELLKNIWNAEEMQTMGYHNTVQDPGGANLQHQGSLTLPRTLSQKTVDQVWKDLTKEYSNGFGQPNLPPRQRTLGEMTLEEFLVKAGVVREENQLVNKSNNNSNGLFTNLTNSQNNPGFGAIDDDGSNQISFHSTANLPLSGNGIRSTQNHQQQQLFPKQKILPYGGPMGIPTSNLVSAATLQGGMGGGGGGVTVAAGSPAVSSDGLAKSNGDTSSVSPVPYVFNGVLRGRKNSAIEKVVERRQRRMIKNRESAARSRARKQAYTLELEAEVSELKQKNQELKRKQEEMMEMQKNKVMEMVKMQHGTKRHCLKKTLSGPW